MLKESFDIAMFVKSKLHHSKYGEILNYAKSYGLTLE